ncbi:MAG TPA: CHAD domain-containing protein [Ktedonobacteraceae bacterium]|nr:CHAD domain-containing protein [Ktedonobacteraceae bacterium]
MAKAKPIGKLNAQAPTGVNARTIARTRLEEMYSWEAYVDNPYRVRELHNLRIAAKRLRYTLEIFQAVLPEVVAPIIKEVEQLQEELGALHDSDVLIALLRLCLGSQDSGTGYEQALMKATHRKGKGRFALNPALVAYLVDPSAAPSSEQRRGLEQLLLSSEHCREEQYSAFLRHWSQLQSRNFRQEILDLLHT